MAPAVDARRLMGLETHEARPTTDQLTRKLLHELFMLQTESAAHLAWTDEQRRSHRAAVAAAERQARAAVEGWDPQDRATALRTSLKRLSEEEPPPSTAALIATDYATAAARWRTALHEAESQIDNYRRELQEFDGRLLKRRSRRPRPTASTWALLDELAWLYDARHDLREAHVAKQVRAASAGDVEVEARVLARRQELDRRLAEGRSTVAAVVGQMGPEVCGWPDLPTGHPAVDGKVRRHLRLGLLRADTATGELTVPAAVGFPLAAGIAVAAPAARRSDALAVSRQILLRALRLAPPGTLHCTVVDPVSLGQSVADLRHLAEFDERIVDVKTWTSEREVERRLDELAAHLEVVISNHLRGQFRDIDEYNEHAGEVAEPYRLLVVHDFPEAFTDTAARQLLSLVENGPRCGVMTVLVHDPGREHPQVPTSRIVQGMTRIEWRGDETSLVLPPPIGPVGLPFLPDHAPEVTFTPDGAAASPAAEFLVDLGRGSRQAGNGPVTLERLRPLLSRVAAEEGTPGFDERDPRTWWTRSTEERATAVLGRSGARSTAQLVFSSTEVAGGGIVVGLPRSGKSTALHAAVLSMALAYSPDELELYLVDSKHGVEFSAYAALPHARMVSVHSEREFSVEVLRTLDKEVQRRADLMKRQGSGTTNITEYRRATGKALPRVLLLMDEFHELFEEDDALGRAAFDAFSNLVRLGPFAGIHVVVASQTLSYMPAMDRNTLQLLPMRVAFMCNEYDADVVLGEDNKAVRSLSKQGEGILNPARGEPSRNVPFQGLFVPSQDRRELLKRIRDKADRTGFTRRPLVFDGDEWVPRPTSPVRHRGPGLRLRLGEPYDLGPPVDLALPRARGGNGLLVGGVEDDGADLSVLGALHSCVLDAVDGGAQVHVVDFGGAPEDGRCVSLLEVSTACGAAYTRGRGWGTTVQRLADEVVRRHEAGDYAAPSQLLVLSGVQLALDLAPHDPFALELDGDAPPSPALALRSVTQDGPDVGVHVVMWVDQLAQLERRVGPELVREMQNRAFGSSARPGDIAALTEQHRARDLRPNQLLHADMSRLRYRRVRAYPPIAAT